MAVSGDGTLSVTDLRTLKVTQNPEGDSHVPALVAVSDLQADGGDRLESQLEPHKA